MSQSYHDADRLLKETGRDAEGVLAAIEEAEHNWFEMSYKRGEPGFDETNCHHRYAILCYLIGYKKAMIDHGIASFPLSRAGDNF